MSSLIILESDANELDDIDERLSKDGYRTNISLEHKLRYFWRQFTRSETSLKSSLDSLEQLRKQHGEEMIEVENYVAHIRQLSDEREALTQDLEAENEQLKAELEQMKVEKEAGAYVSEDVCDMLTEAGLSQIGRDTNPVKEQVNYLIKERTSLAEKVRGLEIDNENLRKNSDTEQSDKRLMKLMEEERKDMEEEMNRMREMMKQVKQEERKIHEQEMKKVTEENETLRSQMEKAQKQHNADMTELINRHQDEKLKLLEEKEQEKEKAASHGTKADKVLAEVEQLKVKMRSIELEKTSLQSIVQSLEEDIAKEKEELNKTKISQEAAIKKLKTELSGTKQKLQETEVTLKTQEEEKKTLQTRLQVAQKDLATIRDREAQLSTEKDSVMTEAQSSSKKQQIMIQQLNDEKNSLQERLKIADDTLERQMKQIENLTLQLGEAERSLAEKEEDIETLDKTSKDEINTLKAKLMKATDEAKSLKEELSETKQRLNKVMSDHKAYETSFQEKLVAESGRSKSAEEEKELLRGQIVELRKDLEASLAASMSRETETMEQTAALEKEKENLARELASYINKEKDKSKKSEELSLQVQSLENEKTSLHAVVSAQERQISELNKKLEKVDEKSAELEDLLQKEQSRSLELSTRYEFTQESSSSAKQEVDQLREEVKVMSAQLLRQHNASLDSQGKYERLIVDMRNEIEREREKSSAERHSLASQLEQAMRESRDFSALLRERDEELSTLRTELTNASHSGTKASTALEFESKMRGSLENRTAQLESELSKAWEQVKELSDKVSTLETSKRQLEIELDKKTQQLRQTESTLHRRQAEHTAILVAKDTAQQNADECEAKLAGLSAEFEGVSQQLEITRSELKHANDQLAEMKLTSEENNTLRVHLQEEEVNKGIQHQTVQELEKQVELLRDRDCQLQYTVKEQETQIEALKQKLRNTGDKHKRTEDDAKSLTERVNELQQEVDYLQGELVNAADRIDQLQRKNDERKNKAHATIRSLKDTFAREKRNLESTVLSLQSSLDLTQDRMNKEEEYKGATHAAQKQLMSEKRELLAKLTDNEEIIREHLRSLRQREASLNVLEKENAELHDKVNFLLQEKGSLTRELERTKAVLSSPFTSPKASGPVDSQVLKNALARLNQLDTLDRSFSSPSPDLYSPENRSPERTFQSNTLNGSLSGAYRPGVINSTAH
ncbi:myosin-11-like [Montipora capricornis]|uniref:myosin-11-like n=1 Tax=Montipora capricornis TaxID=246305 RepID=UPI0035F1978D